jgi:hypothetical protein
MRRAINGGPKGSIGMRTQLRERQEYAQADLGKWQFYTGFALGVRKNGRSGCPRPAADHVLHTAKGCNKMETTS